MKIQSVVAKISYRVRVDKSDKSNTCSDSSRKNGFYWIDYYNANTEQKAFIVKQQKIAESHIKTLADIDKVTEFIGVYPNTEHLRIEIEVGFEGTKKTSTGLCFTSENTYYAKFSYNKEILKK